MDPSRQLGERVARLEAIIPEIRDDLRQMRQLMERHIDAADKRMRKQDERISALERWRAGLVGMGAAVGAVVSMLGRYLIDLMRGS